MIDKRYEIRKCLYRWGQAIGLEPGFLIHIIDTITEEQVEQVWRIGKETFRC